MENNFMRAEDVAEVLGVSKSFAYKVMKKLNDELKLQGYVTIAGRVNKEYFMEKLCYSRKDGQ
ncbi:MAG: DNA-binding protein [Phocaeicola sp.]